MVYRGGNRLPLLKLCIANKSYLPQQTYLPSRKFFTVSNSSLPLIKILTFNETMYGC